MRQARPPGGQVILWATLAIIIFAVPHGAQAVSFGYFVRLHGITYSGTEFEEGRRVTLDDLGPEVGRVTCDIAELYTARFGSMEPSAASAERMQKCAERDGGASRLSPGTAIYSIRGYRAEYR